MTSPSLTIPFRIRIGVTGHRVIAEPEKIAAEVARVLRDEIVMLFDGKKTGDKPGLEPIAFTIITPLAEGADRLVAHEVLKSPQARIEVILPLPVEEYMKDFTIAASREEFMAIYRQARNPGIVSFAERWPEIARRDPTAARNRAYEAGGRHVVDNCDVLIALWDGKLSRGRGGTAEIVEYAEKRGRPIIKINPETGETRIERGHGLSSKSLRAVEEFNSFEPPAEELEAYERNVYAEIFGNPEGEKLPAETKDLVRSALIPWYTRTSLIAKGNQRTYRRAGRLVYLLSPLAVALAAAGTVFHHFARWAFSLEALCLGAIFLVIYSADRRRAHRRWTEHRVLAEYLRTAIHLAAAGTEIPRWRIPPYLGVSRPTGDWILRVFSEIWDRLPPMAGCTGELCGAHAAFVSRRWVKDQADYHRGKSCICDEKGHRLELVGWAVFVSAVLVACAHAVFSWAGAAAAPRILEEALTLAALTLPAVGAAVGGYRLHEEYARLRTRSLHMAEALTELEGSFSQIDDPEEFHFLMRKTSMLMLSEVQEWLGLMQLVELSPEPKASPAQPM